MIRLESHDIYNQDNEVTMELDPNGGQCKGVWKQTNKRVVYERNGERDIIAKEWLEIDWSKAMDRG